MLEGDLDSNFLRNTSALPGYALCAVPTASHRVVPERIPSRRLLAAIRVAVGEIHYGSGSGSGSVSVSERITPDYNLHRNLSEQGPE